MAIRALKRRVGRAVYGHLREDHRCRQPGNGQPCCQYDVPTGGDQPNGTSARMASKQPSS